MTVRTKAKPKSKARPKAKAAGKPKAPKVKASTPAVAIHRETPSKSPIGDFEVLSPMSESEARDCIASMNGCIDAANDAAANFRALASRLHAREGWRALGYPTWAACIAGEFGGQNRGAVHRQISAAMTEVAIGVPVGSIPEGRLRPLSKLPEAERKDAWDEAKAGGEPTGKVVAEVVDRRLGKARGRTEDVPPDAESEDYPDYDPDAAEPGAGPAPPAALLSVIDGVASADPPDVAELRAAGKIGPDTVVDVSGEAPGPDEPAPGPTREPGEDEPETDEEWLATLPVRAKLGENARVRFDRDALAYRAVEKARDTFAMSVRSTLKGADRRGSLPPYLYRVRQFLKINDPDYWTACPKPADGGCGGSGMTSLGACPECHGDGYRI